MLPGFRAEQSVYRSRNSYIGGSTGSVADSVQPAASNCLQTGANSWACNGPGWPIVVFAAAAAGSGFGPIGGLVGGLLGGLYCWIFGCD